MLLAESVLQTWRVHAMHQLKLASEVRSAPSTHRYGLPKLIHHVKFMSWLPYNTYKALFGEMTSKMATLASNPKRKDIKHDIRDSLDLLRSRSKHHIPMGPLTLPIQSK